MDSILGYTSDFDNFKGSFEDFTRFSDALTLYIDVAANLNDSCMSVQTEVFKYPVDYEISTPYTLDSGSVVQTCLLNTAGTHIDNGRSPSAIWPFCVFEYFLRCHNIFTASAVSQHSCTQTYPSHYRSLPVLPPASPQNPIHLSCY
jgi:hypothetical protein